MHQVNAGQAIVDALIAEGVDHVFGMPGGHVLRIYDALHATPSIKHVLVRHEQTAASMAAGYAQLTGRPGVCLVTAGPGATNLLTGIAEAFVGCLPVVVLAGRGATLTARRGASQEVSTERIFEPVTKHAIRVDRADIISEVMREAFATATCGRPGPVLVDLPVDVLEQDVPGGRYRAVGAPQRVRAAPEAIAEAAESLHRAQRPIIVAGGGATASDAGDEVVALAETLRAPVLTSLAGRGVISDAHPLSVGGLGTHRNPVSAGLLADADVVLSLGCRFEEMETNWHPDAVPSPEATYIQVDIEPSEISRSVPAQVAVIGDVRAVVSQISAALVERGVHRTPEWRTDPRVAAVAEAMSELEGAIARLAERQDTPMHPLQIIRAARRIFPTDAIVGFDVGALAQQIAGAAPFFRVYEPRSTLVPSSFYGMGFVSGAMPVAGLVHPHRPALCFVGDGSFALAMAALPVAAEQRVGVTWCVLNDGALGSIWDIQQHVFDGRILDTTFDQAIDFAGLARACGCAGFACNAPEQVEEVLAQALAANRERRPAVIDFAVSRERMLQSIEHWGFYPEAMASEARALLGRQPSPEPA